MEEKQPRPKTDFILEIREDLILLRARKPTLKWILLTICFFILLVLILTAIFGPDAPSWSLETVMKLIEILLALVVANGK
jgi:hypothetical protein